MLSLRKGEKTKYYLFMLTIVAVLLLFTNTIPVLAYNNSWVQTDWSGGSGQSSWSDPTKFSSSSSVSTSVAGEATISPTTNWYNSSWTYRRKITFNNSAQAENLTSFPVMVKLDSTRIDYTNTQNAGQDIRFTDSDGVTLLDHEIEKWDEAGSSTVWVRVPQIDASSSTDYVYMYYGNTGAADAQDAAGVWGSQIRYHLKETTATDANLFKASGYFDTGKLSRAVSIYGNATSTTGSTLTFSRGSQISGNNYERFNSSQGTISLWIKPSWDGNDGVFHTVFAGKVGTPYIAKHSTGFWYFYYQFLGQPYQVTRLATDVVAGNWYHVVARWDVNNTLDGTNHLSITVNNATSYGATSLPINTGANDYFFVGRYLSPFYPANALIDDFAIFDRVLTTTEITALYNSSAGREAGYVTDPSLKFYAKLDGPGTLSPVTYNLGASADQKAYNSSTNTNGNMVVDGNMEAAGTANWSAGGTRTQTSKTNSSVLADTQSIRVEQSASQECTADRPYVGQNITVAPNTNYSFSLWYKSDSGAGARVYVRGDVSGKLVDSYDNQGYDTSQSWKSWEATFKTGASDTSVQVRLYTNSCTTQGVGSTFDNVQMAPSYVNNGGMEGTYVSGTAPNWTCYNGATCTEETSSRHSGSKSQKMVLTNASMGIYQNITTTPGNWYMGSVWLRVTNGTIYWRDGSTPISGSSQPITSAENGDTWKRYSQIFQAVAADTVYQSYFNSPTGSATFYIDDVSIIPLDNVSASFQAWAPVNDAVGNNPMSVNGLTTGVGSTTGQAGDAFVFDQTSGFLRQKTYDINQGNLTYQDTNTDISDAGQEFEDWDNDDGGTAEYMVVVTNSDNTTSWGYLCANDGGAQTAVYTLRSCTGGAEGFNGTSPSGKTPVGYEVRKNDFQITGTITFGTWVKKDWTDSATFGGIMGKYKWGSSAVAYRLGAYGDRPLIHVGGSGLSADSSSFTSTDWSHLIATYDGSTRRIYLDGVEIKNSAAGTNTPDNEKGFVIGGDGDGNAYFERGNGMRGGSLDEAFVIDGTAFSAPWISAQYLSETDTFITYAAEEQHFPVIATLTSSIFDAGFTDSWGSLNYTAITPANTSVSVKVRTGNNSDLSDAASFALCSPITSGQLASTGGCASTGSRYAQYLVTFGSTDGVSTPTLQDISLSYSIEPYINMTYIGPVPVLFDYDHMPYYFTSQTPTISGNAQPGSTIYFIANNVTYTATADNNGNFSITLQNPALSRGLNIIEYYSRDTLGYTSSTKVFDLTVGIEYFPNWLLEKLGLIDRQIDIDVKEVEPTPTPTPEPTEEPTPEPTPTPEPEPEEGEGVKVEILVIDPDNNPIEGALVRLHSDVREAATGEDGLVVFEGVERGEHELEIEYVTAEGTYTGMENLLLQDDTKYEYRFEVVLRLERQANILRAVMYIGIGVLLTLIAVFLRNQVKSKKGKANIAPS